MSDILQTAAHNFEKVIKSNYEFVVGSGKKQISFIIPSVESGEFTHIFGLDHLTDIDVLSAKNIKQKSAIFNKIVSNQISFQDIAGSKFLIVPIDGSYNNQTQSEYTINDRIRILSDFEHIMDSAYNGKIYKWKNKKSNIKMPNGKFRKTKINADYLITIPSQNINETLYLFAYQTNKNRDKSEPIYLNIFSAFPDGVNLTIGQEKPYTILEEKKNGISIFMHPAYKKQIEQHSTKLQQPPNNNVKSVKFDSPVPSDILPNASGAAAAVIPAPNPFRNIFEQIKEGFKNLFKKQDKSQKHSDTDQPIVEEKATDTYDSPSELEPVPEQDNEPDMFEDLCTARKDLIKGNISFDEYKHSLLKRVIETIENGLRLAPVFVQPAAQTTAASSDSEELSAALDFADSF